MSSASVAQTWLDLNQIPGMSCGQFGADESYVVPGGAIPLGVTLHLPYGSVPSVTGPNANPITLVGLRRFSSPISRVPIQARSSLEWGL